ncbi:hypothetical protein WMY93_017648 [Mugilogobius chulae]|uniref:Saposin B-type domain-containing protein n=1 Tax=Mugilogobius chulae TaxID=88201 RepID=A0AAW0NPD3_9GOBI
MVRSPCAEGRHGQVLAKSWQRSRSTSVSYADLRMTPRVIPVLALLLVCIGFPGTCQACKYIVRWVKGHLGKDSSKEKIGALLNRVCNRIKSRLVRSGCKWVVRRVKNKLIDAIVNRGSPRTVCRRLRLCKRRSALSNYMRLEKN